MQNNQLTHIRWLGGSPCSGKSSVSRLLSERLELSLYQVDFQLREQMDRLDPERHPALSAWMAATCDERWLKPLDELMADAVACYTDHFSLILEDLNALSSEQITLAEGTALLPHLVAKLGIQPDAALWLTPAPSFQIEYYGKRPWVAGMLADCSDPERAFDNWMERDIQFARWVANEADHLGFALLRVDGSQSIEANAIAVADHFGFTLARHQTDG